jgi:hypothetical protein
VLILIHYKLKLTSRANTDTDEFVIKVIGYECMRRSGHRLQDEGE